MSMLAVRSQNLVEGERTSVSPSWCSTRRFGEHPLITSIELKNCRGIRSGMLTGFRPLTIITGGNGSGKSSILDGLLIGASPDPAGDIGVAVSRHALSRNGGDWLRFRGNSSSDLTATIVKDQDGTTLGRWFAAQQRPDASDALADRHMHSMNGPFFRIACKEKVESTNAGRPTVDEETKELPVVSVTEFDSQNLYHSTQLAAAVCGQMASCVKIVDPAAKMLLTDVYSEVKRAGRAKGLADLLSEVGLESLEILTERNGVPTLYVTRGDLVVPLSLAGDGLNSLAHTLLHVAAVEQGLLLLEEPEAFQHPRSLMQTAKGIVAGIRRGVQIVLSTHSQELIDDVLACLGEEHAEDVALFTVELDKGVLRSGLLAGHELFDARWTHHQGVR